MNGYDQTMNSTNFAHQPPPDNFESSDPSKNLSRPTRTPSAPVYPRGQPATATASATSNGHHRAATSSSHATYPSATRTSLDRRSPPYAVSSIDVAYSVNAPYQQPVAYPADPRYSLPSRQSGTNTDKSSSSDLEASSSGTPPSSTATLVDSTQYPNTYISAGPHNQRPPPPHHSYTGPADSRWRAPRLRQSASYAAVRRPMETITPPQSDNGTTSPKRFSDDSRDAKAQKKKSGISSFLNSMMGSPRKMNISNPENPVHVTHVGYDNETGQFTVGKLHQAR